MIGGFAIVESLFENTDCYIPRAVELFEPRCLVLAKGSLSSPARRNSVERICQLYPTAQTIEELDTPHNRINLAGRKPLEFHYRGKQTLVFGEHKSAVRLSDEQDNTCPNYWHFSPYGFCPYDCKYCYLAGTPGVSFSPTVKVFLNLTNILDQIDSIAKEKAKPTAFYLGKLQDGLALDPLTGYSRVIVPFFARHPYARQILLTKSADVDNLLDLEHRQHTILSWSLNPSCVCSQFEAKTPSLVDRIKAMQKCASAGYPIRAVIMPIIPVYDWEKVYTSFLSELLASIQLERITLGCICSYSSALGLMEAKLGPNNVISQNLNLDRLKSADGRTRYPESLRLKIYEHLISVIRQYQPELDISLCLEDRSVSEALNLTSAIGRCNCVL